MVPHKQPYLLGLMGKSVIDYLKFKTQKKGGVTEMLNRMKIGILYLKYQIRWRFVDFVKPSAPFLTTAGIKFHMARQEHLKFLEV